jgi:hypothetical protein
MSWTRSLAILVVLAFGAEARADKVDWSSYIDHDSKPMPVAAAKPLPQSTAPTPAAKPAKTVAKAKPKARTSAKPKPHHK